MSAELIPGDVAVLAYLRQEPAELAELLGVLSIPGGPEVSVARLLGRGFIEVVSGAYFCTGPGAAYLDERSIVAWAGTFLGGVGVGGVNTMAEADFEMNRIGGNREGRHA